jgi:DNA-3-methyladenine glycosylase I
MTAIRRLTEADLPQLERFWEEHWGSAYMVAHETIYYPHQLSGFVVEEDAEWIGLATYIHSGTATEITSLDSLREGQGIGSALITAVLEEARQYGSTRVWLITTNDNMHALRFYQRCGFALVAVYPGAVNRARLLKPTIPLIGFDGIPLRDELELELLI